MLCGPCLTPLTRGLALYSHEPACLGAATTQTIVRSDTVLASVFRPKDETPRRSSLGGKPPSEPLAQNLALTGEEEESMPLL